jgi:ubiquinone/menaquinone biosynthesis C-methylase UbiE
MVGLCILIVSCTLTGASPAALADRLPVPDHSLTTALSAPKQQSETPYTYRTRHNSDGIGKYYMGREIAQVMGHQGAGWLERISRSWEEQPQKVIEVLDLKPTDVVADIGAGTGYFSQRIAQEVLQGQVLAVDIQPEMLEILESVRLKQHLEHLELVLGTTTDPGLPPNSIDLALMVDAYHEFDHPREMMQAIVRALKPGGRVALVEYRGENPLIPIKSLHKMTQKQVRQEMAVIGLNWLTTDRSLPQQHILIFQKPVF